MKTPTENQNIISKLGAAINRLANPARFMSFSASLLPWLGGATVLCLGVGLVLSFQVPEDVQHGYTVKMMFVHVPMAWISLMAYTVIFASSIGYLVWRHPLADVSAKAATLIGATFTFLALATGSLWGKPGWGSYWVWQEPRIVSVLVLFFLYIGLMALRSAIEDDLQARFATAVLSIVGFIIVPIIKYSVEWWNTLHQPAGVLKGEVHTDYLIPLLIMAIGFTLLFVVLHLLSMRNEILRQKIQALRMRHVERHVEL